MTRKRKSITSPDELVEGSEPPEENLTRDLEVERANEKPAITLAPARGDEARDPAEEPPLVAPAPAEDRPLAETMLSMLGSAPIGQPTAEYAPQELPDEPGESTDPRMQSPSTGDLGDPALRQGMVEQPPVSLGETLQLVRYARRGDTLLISGLTPHGRRLTFEQREDRLGWYVVAAGRRRRPTERELGLVVNTITQEMEAALDAERQTEVRSAYRLAVASDDPGMPVPGLDAYRDILLDEAEAFGEGERNRLAVIAVDYQAFKRFANRHGHRIGAAFVRALGERLHHLFKEDEDVSEFHKSGKSFRLIVTDKGAQEIEEIIDRITSQETKEWLVRRVWGEENRTHPDEVNFHVGVARAYATERGADYEAIAQRLNDDAYRASKVGQLQGHTSIALAKSDYRTTVYWWKIGSEEELGELAAQMDDGPQAVNAEMADYLHELSPVDLEGMAVAGDVTTLIHRSIARDGFWQGTTAMRIAGERLINRFLAGERAPPDERNSVGGFDLGDEFYGFAIEGEKLYFACGDVNSAGATRVRAGLESVQRAVGWCRTDGGGIVGRFVAAVHDAESGVPFVDRIRKAAELAFLENDADPELHVNDIVDIGDFLLLPSGSPVEDVHIREGAKLVLAVPGGRKRAVEVLERRSVFMALLSIDGVEHPASVNDSITGPQVKLRVRKTVASPAICVLEVRRSDLIDMLREVREDNDLAEDSWMDVVGFLRHVADILLEDNVKLPGKVELALGARYDPNRFVRAYTLDDVRERHPGLFYEAVHQDLLESEAAEIDRNLVELIGTTMLGSIRPPV